MTSQIRTKTRKETKIHEELPVFMLDETGEQHKAEAKYYDNNQVC